MNNFPILIHFHLHPRRTGVTTSIENVLPYLEKDFKVYVYGKSVNWKNQLNTKELKDILANQQKVIIHVHRNNEIQKALLLRFLGYDFKLIATRHAATPPSWFTRFLLKKSDKIVGLIKSMKNDLGDQIEIIGHGVDINRFQKKMSATNLDIKQKKFFLVAGRIRKAKGQKTFIDALIPLLKTHKDLAAVMIGKVDEWKFVDEIQKIVKNEKLTDQVYILPPTDEIELYYSQSLATIVPSHSEGFSLVAIEAMACETIVVATENVGIHNEIIDNGLTGYLFKPGDPMELNRILDDIVQGKSTISIKKSKEKIFNEWTSQLEAQKLKELYLGEK